MKKIIFCIFMLIFGLSTTTVYGDELICTSEFKENLKEQASKVKYKYEKVSNVYDDNGNYIVSGYKITAENLTKDIYACAVKGNKIDTNMCMLYNEDHAQNYFYYTNQEVDRLVVYGATCYYEYASEKFKGAKYNPYSEREECKDVDITKLRVCDPYYEYEVTDNIFNYQLQEYLNNQNKDNNDNKDNTKEPTKKDNNIDTTSNIVDYVKNYGLYIISIIAVFVIVVIVVKKRKDKRGVL